MITIDFPSGKITPDFSGAVTAATAGQRKVGVHLTKGYISPDVIPATQQNNSANSPVKFKGDVDVHVDTKDEVDQVLAGSFFFGFLQVAKIKQLSASWEGRRDSEGSVHIAIIGFPVSDTLVLLDSDPNDDPFFTRNRHIGSSRRPGADQRRLVEVSATMGDHPNYRDTLTTANATTKAKNFLNLLDLSVEFTTVFVVRDGDGPIQPIAHIQWNLELHGSIKWRAGRPLATGRLSSLVPGASTLGAPADANVRAVIDNPGPPFAKGVAVERYREAMSNRLMRQESEKRSIVLPRDFFL